MYDVAVIGGGIAGMSTAARLQSEGLRTIVFEAHGLPGGCAGFFRRAGFAFDVGATTLVDVGPEGVGGELLETMGMPPLEADLLPGYVAWLPDRKVTLHRDPALWADERLRCLGDTAAHRELWAFFDRVAGVFWSASRRGVKLPIRTVADAVQAVQALGLRNFPLARYLRWTVRALARHSCRARLRLRGPRWCVGLPLLTVHLPHRDYGDTPFTQTHTLRGLIIPSLFLELTYHLEHHLYPQVPSHNLAKLSKRLEPIFREAGVVPWRVP